MERARKAIVEALLGPSLCESGECAVPPVVEAAPPGTVYHFAYGANMAFGTLARRGVRPLSRDGAMIADPAVRMRFRHRGGYATLESMPHVADSHNGTNGNSAAHHNGHSNDHSPSGSSKGPSSNCHRAGSNGNGHAYSYMYSSASSGNGFAASTNGNGHSASGSPSSSYDQIERPRYPPFDAHVHGVLYKLKVEDLDKLSKKEGGYVLKDFEVQTYDGRRFLAKAYVSGPMATLPAEVAPTEKYMRLLREGAGDNYLDPLHQAWLSSVETVSSAGLGEEYWCTPSRFIAYGFLAVAALLVVGFFARP